MRLIKGSECRNWSFKSHISEIQNGEKEKIDQTAKKSKKTVFIVGDSVIKKINGYLLTKSINHKFLVKVRPFTTSKTIDT